MKFKFIVLIVCFTALAFLSGCRNEPPPVNIDAQKKVISTYLESIQKNDKEKYLSTLAPELRVKNFRQSSNDIFEPYNNMGKIEKWDFDGEKYVDEQNNQAIIGVSLKYPKSKHNITFDLRKYDQWLVFGVKTENDKPKNVMN